MGLAFLRGLLCIQKVRGAGSIAFCRRLGRLTAVNQNENLARKGHRGWLRNSVPKSYATALFL